MYTPLVSVIIPALNEERRLPRTLQASIEFLQKQNYASEILVVTDGSIDRTKEIAESYVAVFPTLRVISFPVNHGEGFAVKVGMREAKGRYKLLMDADYAVPLDFLTSFLEQCQSGYEVVIGSRTHKDSQLLKKQGFPRHQFAIAFRFLQKLVLRLPYWDTQCGFKLFTDEAANRLFSQITYNCSFFHTELLYLAHRQNMKVFEHAITWHHDSDTRLPIGFKRSLELLHRLFMIEKIHARIKN